MEESNPESHLKARDLKTRTMECPSWEEMENLLCFWEEWKKVRVKEKDEEQVRIREKI